MISDNRTYALQQAGDDSDAGFSDLYSIQALFLPDCSLCEALMIALPIFMRFVLDSLFPQSHMSERFALFCLLRFGGNGFTPESVQVSVSFVFVSFYLFCFG